MRPTEDQTHMIAQLVRTGNSVERAAQYVGVPQDVVDGWMEEKGEFYSQVTRAYAEADLRDMAVLSEAATDSWQAAAARIRTRREADQARRVRDADEHLERLRELTT